MVMTSWVKGLPLRLTIGELFEDLVTISSYFSVLSNILPRETLEWKLRMLKSAYMFANSQLDHVKAQTLILSSGNDQLLPNQEEGRRLRQVLQKCEIRNFHGSGHFLFLEDGFDLVSVLKGTYFYRRGRKFDYVSDFMPVTRSEFSKFHGRTRVLEVLTGSVMFSTSVDGKIMRGLDGIPSEGPVLIVGNHMLLGFDLVSLPDRFFAERNIILRGMGHPLMFARLKDGLLPDISRLDSRRMQGGVPVSAYNLHKLLSSNSHVLLYPGGIREAMHRKGEEYTLFWPENPEFVRIAAKFGATIIPFGVVGADDVAQVVFDYNDQMKIPLFRSLIESLTSEAVKLRADADGELANQDLHIPAFFPKIPGRFYYYFGTPIKTKGRMSELKDKEKSRELYAEVKSEVKRCIAFLKEKREYDPYSAALAACCKDLQELRVFPSAPFAAGPNVALTEQGLVSVSEGCPKLQSVLYFCRQMTNAALVTIAKNSPNLTRFRLCIIEPRTPDYLTLEPLDVGFGAIVEHCKDLRRLSLSGLLTDRVFEYIGTWAKRLEMLSVAFAGDSDKGLHHVLSGCDSLRKLEIRDCPFGDKALLANAAKLETMRSLWMSSCSVSFGACKLLGRKMPLLNVEVIDEQGSPDARPESCPVEKLYVYRTVAGPRFDMPAFVWTMEEESALSFT